MNTDLEQAFFLVEALEQLQGSRWHTLPDGRVRNQHGECPLEALATELYGHKPRSLDFVSASDALSIRREVANLIVYSADNERHAACFHVGLREALLDATGANRTWRDDVREMWRAFREFSQNWVRS